MKLRVPSPIMTDLPMADHSQKLDFIGLCNLIPRIVLYTFSTRRSCFRIFRNFLSLHDEISVPIFTFSALILVYLS